MICNTAFAKQYEFNQLSTFEGFDLRFRLDHDVEHTDEAVLDCQSFIQKFDFYDDQGNLHFENVININECQYLHNQVVTCFDNNQPKCFDTDNIFKDSCLCD